MLSFASLRLSESKILRRSKGKMKSTQCALVLRVLLYLTLGTRGTRAPAYRTARPDEIQFQVK